MYLACRQIKPNGLRCKSPALRGRAFCSFHSKLHATSRLSSLDDIKLPPFENPAAIKVALRQVLDALLSSRIDSKRAGQILYGLQIASQNVECSRFPWPTESVQSVIQPTEGEEPAPELHVCNHNDDCNACQYAKACPNYDPDDEEDEVDVDV